MSNRSRLYSSFTDTSFGQKELSEYRPHLDIRKVHRPNARSNRPFCWKTGRHHEFLSDGEERYYLYLLWADDVVDIREQFALDINETSDIAKRLKVRHPSTKDGKVIMSTDFLITLNDRRVVARSYKMTSELSKEKVLNKLSIEKIYWESKGVEWGIVHEKLIDRVVADNIGMFNECRDYIDKNQIPGEAVTFLINSISSSASDLAGVCDNFDAQFRYECGTGLKILSNLVANKSATIHMFSPFSSFMKCSEIHFNEAEK